MTFTPALRLTEDDLTELREAEDPVAELAGRLEERRQAARERRERAQETTLEQALALIRATPRRPRVRDTDPETAHDAALQASRRQATIKARILWTTYELGPQTFDEIAQVIGEAYSTVSTACSDLIDWGWLEPTGETRETRRGGSARVLGCTLSPDTGWRQAELELEGS